MSRVCIERSTSGSNGFAWRFGFKDEVWRFVLDGGHCYGALDTTRVCLQDFSFSIFPFLVLHPR
jgi:hypothetical protein